MKIVRQRARFDWLVELGSASVFACGCAYAAFKLAPSFAVGQELATLVAGSTFLVAGMAVIRLAHGGAQTHRMAEFAVAPMPIELDELLLDTPIEEPIMPAKSAETFVSGDVLLLDDPLPRPDPASRVVQLFASLPVPTPGQLKEQIDRHLSESRPAACAVPDASEALYAALDELRRSLR